MKYNVIKAEETEHGVIVHEIDGKETEKIRYSAIRAGLSWPVKGSSGYYCILGEEYVERNLFTNEQPRGKLVFLKELKATQPFLDVFFLPLTDDSTLYLCEKVYTDLSEDHADDAKFYQDYLYEKKLTHGRLEEAPYISNFNLGVSLIRRWIDNGLLTIPKDTIVHDQLSQIAKLDLDASPETIYFAVNALRFAVGAFYKSPPSTGGIWIPDRPKR
jgi:hypothetical protein